MFSIKGSLMFLSIKLNIDKSYNLVVAIDRAFKKIWHQCR